MTSIKATGKRVAHDIRDGGVSASIVDSRLLLICSLACFFPGNNKSKRNANISRTLVPLAKSALKRDKLGDCMRSTLIDICRVLY
jgi:hypothetical protein